MRCLAELALAPVDEAVRNAVGCSYAAKACATITDRRAVEPDQLLGTLLLVVFQCSELEIAGPALAKPRITVVEG